VPITIVCSQCQQPLSVKEEHAGKRGKCPKCQAIIPIPAASAVQSAPKSAAGPPARSAVQVSAQLAGPPPAPAKTAVSKPPPAPPMRPPQSMREKVFAGFRAPAIERVGATPLYQLGILLTAFLMILLPLIYIAIIALVCLVVWWHLTHNHVIVGAVRGRAALMALVVYLAPIVIGGIVIVFMFKPLFAPPAKEGRRRSLTPTSDPLLFEFVERICALVGAAMPRRIDVDCEINASAGFRRRSLSLVTGRDLVLTIGMPLAAGLSLQQFAGVLAHEFGHFSQGAGMRLTYIIRSINFWFLRVVYERDTWDEWLATAADGLDIRVGWVVYVARACVWLTRRILWVLMYVGHLVAGFMLRQMEFDADKYETRLAGSENFAATSRQLKLLAIAWRGAEHDLASYHREGRLVDNLPTLLLSNLKQLPKEAHEFVSKMTADTETGWFDSHPADRDRIAAAAAERAPGVFQSELPARVLFNSFDAAAKGVTWDYYCSVFGTLVDPKSLHPTEELLARTEGEQTASKARERFFAGAFTALRPLRLPVMHGEKGQPSSIWEEQLDEARQAVASLAPEYRETIAAFDKADTRLVQSRQARSILSTGTALRADRFEAVYRSPTDASRLRDASLAEMNRLGSRLEPLEDAMGQRLRAALMLLFDPAIARRIAGAEQMQRDSRQLLPIVSQIANLHASVMELRNNNATLAALLGHFEGNERNESLVREVLDYTARVRTQIGDLKAAFERVDYPFDHAAGQMSVAAYLIKVVPLQEQIGAVCEAAHEVTEKLFELYARAVSRLCVIAESVETDQGFEPLPEPVGPLS
jgi:Peptidase family M48